MPTATPADPKCEAASEAVRAMLLMVNPNTGDVLRINRGERELYQDLLDDGWRPLVLRCAAGIKVQS